MIILQGAIYIYFQCFEGREMIVVSPSERQSMLLGKEMMAGCDGGYRSPFLIYASVWLTG